MDLELLDWLNIHTFPEEARYKDAEYAQRAYAMYVEDLKQSAVTRAVIFATLHVEATEILMGLAGIVRSGNLCGKGEYVTKRRHRTSGGRVLRPQPEKPDAG